MYLDARSFILLIIYTYITNSFKVLISVWFLCKIIFKYHNYECNLFVKNLKTMPLEYVLSAHVISLKVGRQKN